MTSPFSSWSRKRSLVGPVEIQAFDDGLMGNADASTPVHQRTSFSIQCQRRLTFMARRFNGCGYAPSSGNSIADRLSRNASFFRPRYCWFGDATKREHASSACIPILLLSRSPHAVVIAVVAIVVEAFKCVFWCWPLTHVTKERLKGIVPVFTDNDATPPVSIEPRVGWIIAAPSHISPGLVFRRHMAVTCCAVFGAVLTLQTTTALYLSAPEIASSNKRGVSAIADAAPNDVLSGTTTGRLYGRESTESIASYVDSVEVQPVSRDRNSLRTDFAVGFHGQLYISSSGFLGDPHMNDTAEFCYCCGLPMLDVQPAYVLRDDEGLIHHAHQECAERMMVAVEGKAS